MFHVPKVAVFSAAESFPGKPLLENLERLYSVQFVRGEELRAGIYDAALMFGVSREHALRAAESGMRCMAYLGGNSRASGSRLSEVRLASDGVLNPTLRGMVISNGAFKHVGRLQPQAGEEVVASAGNDALWIHRREGRSSLDLVAMGLPDPKEGQPLFPYWQKENWVGLLPMLHFLREVSGWEFPPPRACFVFDDPNLHWKSYGYIRFDQLHDHARQHNYHAAFAMVPIDGWYVHTATAQLLRNGPAHFSLLIHGNNHTLQELSGRKTEADSIAIAAQALIRIRRMEEKFGLQVARVMTAPHEACDHLMANALKRVGFEALCNGINRWLTPNPSTRSLMTVRLSPADFLGDGLPVILRSRITWNMQALKHIRAFFGQPIILSAHHEDVAGGLALLEQLAASINTIGGVQWMGMKTIAETNFSKRIEGDALQVKMFSRRIRVKVPEGIESLSVLRPWLSDNQGEGLAVTRYGSPGEKQAGYLGEMFTVEPGEEVVIRSVAPDTIEPEKVRVSAPGLWAIARRQLTEGRDRVKPVIDKLTGRRARKRT